MRRLFAPAAIAASLLVTAPAIAQPGEPAVRCVHAAMTSLLQVGAAPEQLAPVALSRCFDEIEAALVAANAEAARVMLRRELYEYALTVAGSSPAISEASSTTSLEPVVETPLY